ncbi:hypothetical protein PV10_00628 [Exophiala mesophila]|uniref:Xylanolytic transcriptional activator regulatory domain-containing protein n=1 Tax=Exophiala mesophila TaxID=212818 RepID=A0A0D1ZQC1_EXOME|nr:uncharacterized protein PV10_00628 [Exophiala mesophila]KIV96812.1 hypothetical protein PV10_00628 [Exophiala mesophila]
MSGEYRLTGLARACTACHRRKVRCNLDLTRTICSNFSLTGSTRPRTRKRKHGHTAPAQEPQEGRRDSIVHTHAVPVADSSLQASHSTNQEDQEEAPLSAPPVEATESNLLLNDIEQTTEAEVVVTSPSLGEVPWSSAKVDFEKYFSHEFPATSIQAHHSRLSEVDMKVLRLYNAFEVPSRVWMTSLLEDWKNYVHPLMPIVQPRWLIAREGYQVPIVLLKAVLLAGARATDASSSFPCKEYYASLKTLIYLQYEKNPMINIVAACLLGWYNQTDTWTVVHDSSRSWLHFASDLAYQISLHQELNGETHASYKRRVWWTLVARDCQVASGTGRPRIFNLKYCSRRLISTEDFELHDTTARPFVAYVKICLILGDLCESYQQRQFTPSVGTDIRNRLFWWLKELPSEMQYFSTRTAEKESGNNFVVRQIYAIYLATVSLLCKTELPRESVSPVALIASSYMVYLMEGFLARNEFSRLPAITSFYILAAAIPHLIAHKYEAIREIVHGNMQIFEKSLVAMSKRWPTSISALKQYQILGEKHLNISAPQGLRSISNVQDTLLFEGFDRQRCNLWTSIVEAAVDNGSTMDKQSNSSQPPATTYTRSSAPPSPGQQFTMGIPANEDILDIETLVPTSWRDPTFGISDTMGDWLWPDEIFQPCPMDYIE